jgi:hypothetical protein
VSQPHPSILVRDMLTAYWKSQAVHVAAALGLADLLKDGPRSADDLARATGTHAPALYRLLRALASDGVFVEGPDGRFSQTALSECLRGDVPGSLRAVALMMGDEHYRAWGELLHSVRTGGTGFERLYGRGVFDYLADNPRAAANFDEAMTGVHGAETSAMLDGYDFSPFGTVVDVGGGNGSVLTAVLRKHPSLRGVLFDLPHVVERAKANLKAAGIEGRCQAVGGSFFESVPAGGDAYLMRHIIHDWDDEKSLTILRNCRKVMGPGAKLLLVESVVPPGNEPGFVKWLDLNMLVLPGGQERAEAEYRDLYAKAGFRLGRVVPTRVEVSVIEGEPV